ncbi:MAG: type I methionyl aminopeptidase [Gaiellales bacterium]
MIIRKSSRELERMAGAGRVVVEALERLGEAIEPGVTTGELDAIAEELIRRRGGVPTFKGYRGFPGSICASPNSMVVHGIPGSYRLEDGDVISIDVGVTKHGFVADSAYTFAVGEVDGETQRLLEACRDSLDAGVAEAIAGHHVGDISAAVQQVAEGRGFSVVRSLVGHGVGRSMHEDPQIPNFAGRSPGPELGIGMTLAIEPMITAGSADVFVDEDGWSIYTQDGSLAAHFEHTVAVTEDGPRVLTYSERLAANSPVGSVLR